MTKAYGAGLQWREMKLGQVTKIAILRANALGDFIFVLPALQAIKHSWPEAELVYLGCPWHVDFLNKRTPVNRIISVPANWAMSKKLQDEHFDVAFQMHGGGRDSNPFVKQLGAGITVGLQDYDAIPLDITVPYVYYQNEYHRYLEVVKAAGGKVGEAIPRLKVLESDKVAVRKELPELTRPYVVMHPGASDARRRWPAEKFAMVGDWLASQGLIVVVTGIKAEHAVVKKVVQRMSARAIDASGRLTLQGLTGLLAGARLLISNDTGPYHLAVAINVPAVGLFWCGNVIIGAPPLRERWRMLISWQVICPLCGMNVAADRPFRPGPKGCKHPVSFVKDITVEEVKKEITSLLGY